MSELVMQVDQDDRPIGAVERAEAVRRRLLHRVAGVVCRDRRGRLLVHRRPARSRWFGGCTAPVFGGAVHPGESYPQAAAREIREELGVQAQARLLFTFHCRGDLYPYWFGLHEIVLDQAISPDPAEMAWHDWLTVAELRRRAQHWPLVPDAEEAFDRYLRTQQGTPAYFTDAEEARHYLGGLFHRAAAHPQAGPLLRASGLAFRLDCTDPAMTLTVRTAPTGIEVTTGDTRIQPRLHLTMTANNADRFWRGAYHPPVRSAPHAGTDFGLHSKLAGLFPVAELLSPLYRELVTEKDQTRDMLG